jgi:hypothetical protein
MKIAIIGAGCADTYKDIKLSLAKKKSSFGDFYYFKDSIYLLQKEGVTEYHVDQSSYTQKVQLAIKISSSLLKELNFIMAAILETHPELKFKSLEEGQMIFIKISDGCSKITTRGTLQFTLRMFGIFVKPSTGDAYFQWEVEEALCEKLSLLLSTPNFVPNAEGM